MTRPARIAALVAVALGAASCVARVQGDDPGYDLDEPLPVAVGRADPCAEHPGGVLDGEAALVRVDKEDGRQLAAEWEPADLVTLDDSRLVPGRVGSLRAEARDALVGMLDSALAEAGHEIRVRSAYRSFVEQCLTWNAKVAQHGLEHATRYSARPGRSQHQLGTTVDLAVALLGWDLVTSFGASEAGMWLADNAWRFGFALSYPEGMEDVTGYAYEPWHFRYVGTAATAEMQLLDLDLDAYLRACEPPDTMLACGRPPPLEPDPQAP